MCQIAIFGCKGTKKSEKRKVKSEKFATDKENMYLCTNEIEIHDSSTYQWLGQDDDCARADGIADGGGLSGATVQMRS